MLPPNGLGQFLGAKKGLMAVQPVGIGQQRGPPLDDQCRGRFQGHGIGGSEIVHLMGRQGRRPLHKKLVRVGHILAAHPGPQPRIPARGRCCLLGQELASRR